jgi:hypothetical protein
METELAYRTRGGIDVRRRVAELPYPCDTGPLAAALDARRGNGG